MVNRIEITIKKHDWNLQKPREYIQLKTTIENHLNQTSMTWGVQNDNFPGVIHSERPTIEGGCTLSISSWLAPL